MLFSHKLERTDRVAELLCLLAAAAAELLFFLLEDRAGGLAYVYVEQYLTVPEMLFLGFGLSRNLSRQGKRMILLGIAVLGWFFVSQTSGGRQWENRRVFLRLRPVPALCGGNQG